MNLIIVCTNHNIWRLYIDSYDKIRHSSKWYMKLFQKVNYQIVSMYGKSFVENDITLVYCSEYDNWNTGKYSSKQRDKCGYSCGGKYVVCPTNSDSVVSKIAVEIETTMKTLIEDISKEKNEAKTLRR